MQYGETHPCWWNTETHIYKPVTAEDEAQFGLNRLRDVTKRIASICKLDWFSTEIALADEFVVVDYVNDEIDTRVQSQALDGVPDGVYELASEGKRFERPPPTVDSMNKHRFARTLHSHRIRYSSQEDAFF